MRKIGELSIYGFGFLTVYYDSKAERNPYRLYHEYNGPNARYTNHHKIQLVRYADLLSVVCYMEQIVREHNEEKRG